jgi:hypothetical protein
LREPGAGELGVLDAVFVGDAILQGADAQAIPRRVGTRLGAEAN